jgi:hypothetical protein
MWYEWRAFWMRITRFGLRVNCLDLKLNRRRPARNQKKEFMKNEVRTTVYEIEYGKVSNTSNCSMLTNANKKD